MLSNERLKEIIAETLMELDKIEKGDLSPLTFQQVEGLAKAIGKLEYLVTTLK